MRKPIPVKGDAPNMPKTVDPNKVKQDLQKDTRSHEVKLFTQQGAELLERTNRPNVLTVEQFRPYVPLFNRDDNKLIEHGPEFDESYYRWYQTLYAEYRRKFSINPYQVTIIIESETDQTVVCIFDRSFTPINSDNRAGNKATRDKIAAVGRAPDVTRDTEILKASVMDVMAANRTDQQIAFFKRIREESAFAKYTFLHKGMSPAKKAEVLAENPTISPEPAEPEQPQTWSGLADD